MCVHKSGRRTQAHSTWFDYGETAREIGQHVLALEKGPHQVQDGRHQSMVGQLDNDDARILIGRIIANVGEVVIARE